MQSHTDEIDALVSLYEQKRRWAREMRTALANIIANTETDDDLDPSDPASSLASTTARVTQTARAPDGGNNQPRPTVSSSLAAVARLAAEVSDAVALLPTPDSTLARAVALPAPIPADDDLCTRRCPTAACRASVDRTPVLRAPQANYLDPGPYRRPPTPPWEVEARRAAERATSRLNAQTDVASVTLQRISPSFRRDVTISSIGDAATSHLGHPNPGDRLGNRAQALNDMLELFDNLITERVESCRRLRRLLMAQHRFQ
jgi:hypothetical protein